MLLTLTLWPGFTWQSSDSAHAADSRPVRLAGVEYLADVPTVIARRRDLFARHGLAVDVEFNQSGRHNLERLLAGEIDFALMALTPIVLDRLGNPSAGAANDPVILASLVHSIRLNHVVVPVASPIEQPTDLPGRRLGLRKGTNAEFAWWLFAHFHGFEPAAVELLDYPVAQIPAALSTGEVDAALIWEPWLSRLQLSGTEEFRSFPGSDVYVATWVLVTSRASAREQPGRSRAVLAAYRDAIAAIDRDPESAITVYARHANVSEDVLRRSWPALDFDLNLRWSLLTSLQQQIDWALRTNQVPDARPIAVLDLIDATPLRRLDPSLVGMMSGDSADAEARR